MDTPKRVSALAWFQGRIWAATYGSGLFVLDGQRWRQWQDKTIPRFLTCLYANKQWLWYGTWMEGRIGFLGPDLHAFTVPLPKLVASRFVHRNNCLTINGSTVWIGTQGYLLSYDTRQKDWMMILPVGSVNALQPMHSSLWLGTEDSLMVLDRKRGIPCLLRVVLDRIEVSCLIADGDNLWLGGQLGEGRCVGRYSFGSNRLVPMRTPFKGSVQAIVATRNRVFVGVGSGSMSFESSECAEGGVFVYDKRSRWWNKIEPLQITDVWSLLVVGQSLLVGGYAGLQVVHFYLV